MSDIILAPTITIDLAPFVKAAEELTAGIQSRTLQAGALKVVDDATYEECRALITDSKKRNKGLEDLIEKFKRPLNDKRNELLALEKKILADGNFIIDICTRKCAAFIREQDEAKRKLEQQLAREAQKRQAALDQEARELEAMGLFEDAQQTTAMAQMAAQVPVLPPVVEVKPGMSAPRRPLVATVTDINLLIAAIAKGKVALHHECRGEMRALLTVDKAVLNAIVSRKQKDTDLPGVSVDEEIKFRG
jgi:hypothetical protein